MLTPTTPYSQPLDNGLIMKTLGDEADVERLSTFNGIIHGDIVNSMTRNLILRHPFTHPEHWLYVEDEATGEIVSTLCLIPWTWRYEDVELKAGEMGIVGTLENYRRRGLSRALSLRHKTLLQGGEYDLSHIQGIPYFYRQFGYEYAIPLVGGWRIELSQIPDEAEQGQTFSFRQATTGDIPALVQFYDETIKDLSISSLRDEAVWRYLLGASRETETSAETWLVLDARQQAVGYWRISLYGFGEGLIVSEGSLLSHPAALAALKKTKALAVERNKPYIRLDIPRNHVLVRTVRNWGAHDLGTYAWQIYIPNVARLLHKLAPVFERRLAASPFAGLTQSIVIDMYREAVELRFETGKLVAANAVGFKDDGELRIPPPLIAPLVLGHRCREELKQAYPDVGCRGQAMYLIDTLFPKVESFIYTIY